MQLTHTKSVLLVLLQPAEVDGVSLKKLKKMHKNVLAMELR